MNLFVRIIRKLLRTSWVLFFRSISTAKPEGNFRSIEYTLVSGDCLRWIPHKVLD